MSNFQRIEHREYEYSSVYTEMKELQLTWESVWQRYRDAFDDGNWEDCQYYLDEMTEIDDEAADLIEQIEAEEEDEAA
jgi:hypothetical protein